MKKIISLLLASLVCLSVFAQTDDTSRNRYALVIANQNYKENSLSTNIADADKIVESLKKTAFDITYKKDLDSSELEKVINSYIDKVNSDLHGVSLIYYTGYAFSDSDKNYLLPVDNDNYHTKEAAINYGVELQSKIADKIKTNAQIYIIDGAYSNPFRPEGTRAIGIKGGLAAAKSSRESVVGFLFSAGEGQTVVPAKGIARTSNFADAVASQIESSSDNLSSVFNTVKQTVASKTANEQVPYSSATTLNFSFNGEELIALKKKAAQANADKTSLESLEMRKSFEEEQAAIQEQILQAGEQSDAAKRYLEEIAARRRAEQAEKDRLRQLEEEERAKQRSEGNNAKIAAFRNDFYAMAENLKTNIQKDSSAEERITYIEENKKSLHILRSEVQSQIDAFAAETDADTEKKVAEIWNQELKITESKTTDNGKRVMTDDARKRRQEKENKVRASGEEKKAADRVEKALVIAQDDKNYLPLISSGYKKLESGTYSVTSFEDALTVRVDDYDGSLASWNLHVTSELFGYTTLFEDDIVLSYRDVTGKKNTQVSNMTDAQLQEYNDDVEVYDSLFRSATPVFYVKLTYELMRWEKASEYHFIPKKLEVIRLGKKNKVICSKGEKELNPSNFIVFPQIEIRSNKEIIADKTRAEKLVASENKARGIEGSISNPSASRAAKKAKIVTDSSFKLSGRNTFYISGDYLMTDLYDMDLYKDAFADYENSPLAFGGEAHLTFSMAKFLYMGLGAGIQKWKYDDLLCDRVDSETKDLFDKTVFTGSLSSGLTVCIANHFRPYAEVGLSYTASPYNFLKADSDSVVGLHAGLGFDVCFSKHFMINFGWNYGWMHYMDSIKNGVVDTTNGAVENAFNEAVGNEVEHKTSFMDVLTTPDFHQNVFSIGLGFTW